MPRECLGNRRYREILHKFDSHYRRSREAEVGGLAVGIAKVGGLAVTFSLYV